MCKVTAGENVRPVKYVTESIYFRCVCLCMFVCLDHVKYRKSIENVLSAKLLIAF